MSRLVFLLEEYSMKVLLEELLPRVFPDLPFLCIAHEGKQDLERSIPRKLRAWREPGARFIVLRDNDDGDCRALKQHLLGLCTERPDTVVRIACQELEAWYLGDPVALAKAFGDAGLATVGQRARFRDPDCVVQPAQALVKLVPSFQKVSGARRMAPLLDPTRSKSRSFRALIDAVQRLAPRANQEVV
jgi:hypothetical protein